jgi:acetyltransferase EpsM
VLTAHHSDPQPLVVLGGGEHARVVIDAALSRPGRWRVVGFAGPDPSPETVGRFGLPHLGGDDVCARLAADHWFVVGVGGVADLGPRIRLVERLEPLGLRWGTVVHASAVVSRTARLGNGVVVGPLAVVNTGADVGEHAIVNSGAVIEHDVELARFVHAGPGVLLGGGARIGEATYLGLGARVRDHVLIGRGVVVGMGSVVVASIPDGARVVGVPARAR